MTFTMSNLVILAAVGSTFGCARTSASCATATAPSPSRAVSSAQIVLAADFSPDQRNDTVLDALRRVRPQFLKTHGSGPVGVSIDDGPVTDLSILETLRVSAIESVRLERASSPVGPPRITPTGGVIFGDMLEVKTRHGPVQPEATRAECSDVRHGA